MMHNQQDIYQLIKERQFETALKKLFANIEENPDIVENYINAGIVLSDAGEIAKAERFFQKALTINPDNGAIYYNLANLYYNQGRYNEAIKLYQTALKNNVATVDCNYMIGMSFNQLEAFKEALPFLMTAAEKDESQDAEIQFQYGLVLCQLEMFDVAIRQLNKVLSIDEHHIDAIYNLGLATYMKYEDIDAVSYTHLTLPTTPYV